MSNVDKNMSVTEDGQTLATTSLSNLMEELTKLVLSNGKVLTQAHLVIQGALESHSSEPNEQTRRSLRLLITSINGSMPNTLNSQSNLTNILSQLLAQGISSIKSEEAK